MERNIQGATGHTISVTDRKNVQISGVTDVESFDEQNVILMTQMGELTIKGFGLHISKIDVNDGDLTLEGEIYEVLYNDSQPSGGGFFSRLFK